MSIFCTARSVAVRRKRRDSPATRCILIGLGTASVVLSDILPAFSSSRTVIAVDPRYFRPTEVDSLLGDATKAWRKLKWKPKYGFQELVTEMARADIGRFSPNDYNNYARDGHSAAWGVKLKPPSREWTSCSALLISARAISVTSSWKPYLGFHFNFRHAFVASPSRLSTSVGRKYRGSTAITVREDENAGSMSDRTTEAVPRPMRIHRVAGESLRFRLTATDRAVQNIDISKIE
jgi:hypothetical protein